MPAPVPIQVDVLIIGGGIAGLWTLARLQRQAVPALLLETKALGAGQTIWSQGIIHGGLKYALTGEASAASRAIAQMPEVWQQCLAGRGEIDLSSVTPLSTHQWLWTTPGLVSRIAAAAASHAIRTPVEKIERDQWPTVFSAAPKGVDVYRVGEPVLPTAQVLEALRRRCSKTNDGGATMILVSEQMQFEHHAEGVGVTCQTDAGPIAIDARRIVLTAGAGNQSLLASLGIQASAAPMQRRPLHMVMAKGNLPPLFGHCLGASTLPRLTVTTARAADGATVWWIGGAIAEDGVKRTESDQITAARREVAACLPWIDLTGIKWATGRIDRAEGLTDTGKRPDEPVIRRLGNVTVVWPTKLAFAPQVAAEIAAIESSINNPRRRSSPRSLVPSIPRSLPVATAPWDDPSVHWETPA